MMTFPSTHLAVYYAVALFSFGPAALLTVAVDNSSDLINVNIVRIILGEDVNYGYFATAPMYEVAQRKFVQSHPGWGLNITTDVLYQPNVKDCSEAGAEMNKVAGRMFDLVDRRSGLTVLFSPGCSLEVAPLADFAREMGVLLIASTSADTSFANRQRYPTFVSFGPTGQGGHVPSLKLFLQRYSWTTVTVFCENLANYLNVASFFGLTCRGIKSIIMAGSDHFTVYYEDFDSRKPETNFQAMLERAKSQSRVIIIESREDIVQKMMIAAYRLNMTADDYVFIYPEPNRLPLYVSLLQQSDPDFVDDVAVDCFLPLIVLNFAYPNWTRTGPVFDAVARLAQMKYNYTYRPDEMVNDDSLSAYEATLAFLQVVQELSKDPQRNLSVDSVKQRLRGHTFHLDTRSVSISPDAFRYTDIIYSRFNRTSGDFETTWKYHSAFRVFEQVAQLMEDCWNGRSRPPLNQPLCGYRGELCFGQTNQQDKLLAITVSVACIVIGLMIGGLIFYWYSC